MVVLVLVSIFLPVSVYAQDYYVDVDSLGGLCSDSNPGTLAQPWCTVGKANSDLQPGDIVYIREGTHGQNINPANSGTPGNYITYKRYNNEEAIIGPIPGGYGIYLRDKSYIKVDGIRTGSMKFWVDLRASPGATTSHNIIQNCYFDGSKVGGSPWAGIWLGSDDTNNRGAVEYNKIINNMFVNMSCQPDDGIYFLFGDCYYNLIEGNYFDGGAHVTIEMVAHATDGIKYNIIRNNYVRNELHTAINVYAGSNWNLVDNNIIRDAGEKHEENWCGSERDRTGVRYVHGGIQLEGSNNIIRRNVMYNSGRMAVEQYGGEGCYDNKFYHNTFYENYRDWDSVTGESVDGNIAKNNIFWASREKIIQHDVHGPGRNNSFINNCMNGDGDLIMWWPFGSRKNISYMEAILPTLWYGNIDSDPEFLDPVNRDFRVQSTSPVIDSGAFLTTITSSDGSGTSFTVDDSRYFMDGWGIIEADLIQLEGQSQTARITNVNYGSHTITVDTSLSWTTGQGVGLAYEGSAPDIGYYEYNPGSPHCTGICKIAPCNSYSSCSSNSESCLGDGYCCSGSCTDTSPPSVPSNLKVDPISTSQIDLSWRASNDPESEVSYYRIYRNNSYIGQTTNTIYSDTGLIPDTMYAYRVSAVNGEGVESGQSTEVQRSTLPPPPPQTGICPRLVMLQHFDDQTKYGEDFSHVYDYSGTGNDGNCIGLTCPTWNSNGRFGGAFEYDGADDYFDAGTDASLNFVNEITLSAWIYSDDYDNYMGILTRRQIFNWFFYVARGKAGFYIRQDGGTASGGADTTLTNGEWHHVAAVYDDSQQTVYFYLNGAPDGSATFADSMASGYWTSLSVGRCYYGSAWQWNGLIDEVAVWNRALSSQEISSLYTGGGPVPCGAAVVCDVDGDVDVDCDVDLDDLIRVVNDFGKRAGFLSRADTDSSGVIDIFDIVFVARRFT